VTSGRQVGGAAAEIQRGHGPGEGRLAAQPAVDLQDDVFDDFSSPPAVVALVGESAKATAGDRGVAEGVGQDTHQQAAAGVGIEDHVGGRLTRAAAAHGGGKRVAVQQAVPLRLVQALAQHLCVLFASANGCRGKRRKGGLG
jgi:hypothetical protein